MIIVHLDSLRDPGTGGGGGDDAVTGFGDKGGVVCGGGEGVLFNGIRGGSLFGFFTKRLLLRLLRR